MIKKLFFQYKEIIMYGIFGVGSTLINIYAYILLTDGVGIYYIPANILAWILAFTFSFITNKLYVFESKNWKGKRAIKEFIGFLFARLGTGVLDTAFMWLFIDVVFINDIIAKCVVNVIVIIINYVASKFWIFRKEQKNA